MKRKILISIILFVITLLLIAGRSFATEYKDLNNYIKIEIPSKYDLVFNNYLYSSDTAIGSEMSFSCSEEDIHIIMYTIKKDIGMDKIINKTVINGGTQADFLDAYSKDKDILNFINEYVELKYPDSIMLKFLYYNAKYGNPLQRACWMLGDTDWIVDNFAIESDDYVTWILIRFQVTTYPVEKSFYNSQEELDIINSFQYIKNNTKKVCNLDFKDVYAKDWFCDAVRYTFKNGIISGYDLNTFAPRQNLKREQLVSILYRIEGEPDASSYANTFSDVPNGAWYTDAIKWAKAKGIVNGYGGTTLFGRGDSILRQDLAIMLFNYAKYKRKDLTIGSFNEFSDSNKVSLYAKKAMGWAIKHGIISGNLLPDGTKTIEPHDNATRAEAAVMIYKFCENVLNVN